jgi:hypothetical protein
MSGIRFDTVALTVLIAAACGSVASGMEGSKVQATLSDRTPEPGAVVRLDVICDCEATGATATVFGEQVFLFPTGDGSLWSGLIGVDLAVGPGSYPLTVVVEHVEPGSIAATEELSVVAKRFAVRRLSVPAKFVKLPEDAIAQIQNESHRLQTLFHTATRPRQWHRPFQAPASAPISGGFGTRSVFNGQPRSPHSGVDFGSKAGTPVVAPAGGVVTLAEPLFFTGSTVVIDHGLGLYSLLAHLSAFAVKEGERVRRGQVIGSAGATGRVTGPHLHWSVRLNGARVDPLSLIALTNELPEGFE